ncbi:MAG TPA: tRNA 2-thiouridine(34) synthase MnmA [Clostridia bacterium]|nr:tRNA 2-thiouridine(34) synthase MnmA [Clostridia bacterium]
MNEKLDRNKVVIGMSGGVDSSVAAHILKEEGFDVTGVYLNLWESIDGGRFKHLAKKNEEDARGVCEKLGVDFISKNHEESFRHEVVEYFINEYLNGRTPNPCVQCNKTIKFKYLMEAAEEIGAYYMATGHYVKVAKDKVSGRYYVKRTKNEKDQSYMFYTLSQNVISRLLMPLGDVSDKNDVRKRALGLGLNIADKKDSQEICFIQDNDYGGFLERNVKREIKPGKFVDNQDNVLGRHKGIPFYTIGQRKGLGIALGKPMYVKDINIDNNNIMLTENSALYTSSLMAEKVNSVKYQQIPEDRILDIKTRYTAKAAPGKVENLEGGKISIQFVDDQRAVTPGQSVVLYEGEDLVGGGIITKTYG